MTERSSNKSRRSAPPDGEALAVTSESTTRWPLLEERAPFAQATGGSRRRRRPRSAWLLTGLAFLCGGLLSAAVFSIGWRHQAQRDTAARTALATATAHVNHLTASLATARMAVEQERQLEAQAVAAERALTRAADKVGNQVTASKKAGASISSGAGALTTSASKIASELKTLQTYLTTTPTGQLDAGYIASQTAYLSQQLTRLQTDGGHVGDSIASFQAGLRKLGRDARALNPR